MIIEKYGKVPHQNDYYGKRVVCCNCGSRWPKEVGEELFGEKYEEVNVKGLGAFSDPLIVDDLVGEGMDDVKDKERFIFNEHPEVKVKACDGLEEFLRRTLKEDE